MLAGGLNCVRLWEPLGNQTSAFPAGFPAVGPSILTALIRPFWAIPGNAGGIVAVVVVMVLALMQLARAAAIP